MEQLCFNPCILIWAWSVNFSNRGVFHLKLDQQVHSDSLALSYNSWKCMVPLFRYWWRGSIPVSSNQRAWRSSRLIKTTCDDHPNYIVSQESISTNGSLLTRGEWERGRERGRQMDGERELELGRKVLCRNTGFCIIYCRFFCERVCVDQGSCVCLITDQPLIVILSCATCSVTWYHPALPRASLNTHCLTA